MKMYVVGSQKNRLSETVLLTTHNIHTCTCMAWVNYKRDIVRPANRDWACQTERCHTLSNKTSLQ